MNFNFNKIEDKIIDNTNEKIQFTEEDINNKVSAIANKMNLIKKELNNKYIERENEIDMLILALVSATNAFLHGPAGTGKSQLTEDLSRKIVNAKYFRILLGKTTEPSEIFGPISLTAMKNDKYKVNTDKKLPTCHIGFTDEVFKANSAILNGLLTIMNEKLFFNDTVEEVPLISLIGASNEYPEEDNLTALYDRFLLKWHVDYIKEAGKRLNLFSNFLEVRSRKSSLNKSSEVAATSDENFISIEDLLFLNEACKKVKVPIKLLKVYNSILIDIERDGIIISDRRKNESLKVVQAAAILDGRNTADVNDFEVLRFTLWNEQNDINIINESVNKYANPVKVKLLNYKNELALYKKEFDDINNKLTKAIGSNNAKMAEELYYDKTLKSVDITNNCNTMINGLDKLISVTNKNSNNYTSIIELRKEVNDYLKLLSNMI